ncbi:hypothetical protein QQF64_025325 [Cirrhinus molitorella]|uniref:Nitroreductase domain-containing protein n=1 Tax=Cirrhinus molitorella TaxID=172907 RepID=A0ABR3NPI3_9TELE
MARQTHSLSPARPLTERSFLGTCSSPASSATMTTSRTIGTICSAPVTPRLHGNGAPLFPMALLEKLSSKCGSNIPTDLRNFDKRAKRPALDVQSRRSYSESTPDRWRLQPSQSPVWNIPDRLLCLGIVCDDITFQMWARRSGARYSHFELVIHQCGFNSLIHPLIDCGVGLANYAQKTHLSESPLFVGALYPAGRRITQISDIHVSWGSRASR